LAARSSIDGSTCWYRLAVIEVLACPSRSDTASVERYTYDGFDRVSEQRKTNGQGGTDSTRYAYDPLDRTTSRTKNVGAAGEKRTDFNYLGLSGEVLSEEIAGQVQVAYQYSPWGQRLSQVKFQAGGATEDSFYGYNPHSDVETLTSEAGDTRATYGYTAYGRDDTESFTGVDKPDPQNPTAEPYNVYRFNAKRFDPASGDYDMGFRDYDPGLNRFLSRDSYNGALADLDLGLNPWTMNRYGFAGGNPVSFIELDGHIGGLPDEDLRELRKAGYTYVMGKGVVPLPSGAASSAGESLVCEKLGACASLLGSSDASSWTHRLTHAPCGARDWAEGFQTNTVPLDAGSTCLVGLSVSLGLGMPNITVPGTFNLSEGGGGTGRVSRDGPASLNGISGHWKRERPSFTRSSKGQASDSSSGGSRCKAREVFGWCISGARTRTGNHYGRDRLL
jgi:RHS repeat-associated protein